MARAKKTSQTEACVWEPGVRGTWSGSPGSGARIASGPRTGTSRSGAQAAGPRTGTSPVRGPGPPNCVTTQIHSHSTIATWQHGNMARRCPGQHGTCFFTSEQISNELMKTDRQVADKTRVAPGCPASGNMATWPEDVLGNMAHAFFTSEQIRNEQMTIIGKSLTRHASRLAARRATAPRRVSVKRRVGETTGG